MSLLQAAGLTLFPPIAGFLSGWSTRNEVKTWYEPKLDKPSWRPPNWYFAPVWTTLYTSMGYASFLVLRDGIGEERKLALTLYGTQLSLNLAWSTIFFGQHKIGLGAATLATLTANVAACIWAFYPINKNAAYLMIPYLGWLAFATALNYDIWKRNCSKNDDINKSR